MHVRLRSRTAFLSLGLFTLLVGTAEARGFRRNDVPNLNTTGCGQCHVNPMGGGARTPFGQQLEAHLDGIGAINTQHVVWSPALAALDADGDGLSNGLELGDPDGVWRIGDAMPGLERSDPASELSRLACGNGARAANEACDDGNASNEDACRNDCQLNVCGDGYVRVGVEPCDDGNMIDDDACSNACASAACGDGVVQAALGEVCDDGNLASDDDCPGTCLPARCGDGFVRAGVEACDDAGESVACNADCTAAVCGDGVVNATAGEACDDGAANSDTAPSACRTTCVAPRCGDGVVDDREECDDANADDTDACLVGCYLAACGDGIVQDGEECDDGSANTDELAGACHTDCVRDRPGAGDDGGCAAGGGGGGGGGALAALALLALVAACRRRAAHSPRAAYRKRL